MCRWSYRHAGALLQGKQPCCSLCDFCHSLDTAASSEAFHGSMYCSTGTCKCYRLYVQLGQLHVLTGATDIVSADCVSLSVWSDGRRVYMFTLTTAVTYALQVLDRLTPVEQQLLSQRLTQLRHVLDPGFSPLNWNSLGIPDFVATCNRVSHGL